MFGETGDDLLLGGDNVSPSSAATADVAEYLHGGPGDDKIEGGYGDDVVIGNGGNDRLTGGPGSDRIFGGAGSDVCKSPAQRPGAQGC